MRKNKRDNSEKGLSHTRLQEGRLAGWEMLGLDDVRRRSCPGDAYQGRWEGLFSSAHLIIDEFVTLKARAATLFHVPSGLLINSRVPKNLTLPGEACGKQYVTSTLDGLPEMQEDQHQGWQLTKPALCIRLGWLQARLPPLFVC
ncbi:hypothetical protein UY3_12039 [Chelonia mydas]|uniref:Uncharacterized protein n=1 Tax=Chelonia mydas TaxID=8469 RepID=M7B1E0_CHEMY|nr:hypothetical protein UY3_12039 [Chelonia mydas]